MILYIFSKLRPKRTAHMKIIKYFSFLMLTLTLGFNSHAQADLSHEFGIMAGPIIMQTDYGERYHLPSSTMTSFGVSVVHYLSFYGSNYNWRNGASFFSDHFKLKTELSYYFTNDLEHKGRYVAPGSTTAEVDKLRAMSGETKMFNIGTQLEYYFKNLEDYGLLFNDREKWAPYISAGVHFNMFSPKLESSMGNWEADPSVLPQKWQNNVYVNKDNTFSLTLSAGTRYKVGRIDLVLDARWQYFLSDRIDGLDAVDGSSKFNDTAIYLNLGVIFDFESFRSEY